VKALVSRFGEVVAHEQQHLAGGGAAVVEAVIQAAGAVDLSGVELDDEPTDDEISAFTGVIDTPWGDQGEDGFTSGSMG
jgi:hypothetical protein